MRNDGRSADQLRPIRIERHFTDTAPGSVCIRGGRTIVLCTASIEESVPPWRVPHDDAAPAVGWVTAEYAMLPGSTRPRKRRERSRVEGRTSEIQRLIGRSLRAVVDFEALGPRTVTVDCDVLQADGGTRTLSITGGFVALVDALRSLAGQVEVQRVLRDSVAAVSVGIVDGTCLLDLEYTDDSTADVDLNVVMTGSGKFIEIQGTAERHPFDRDQLNRLLELGEAGIRELTRAQQQALDDILPFAAAQ